MDKFRKTLRLRVVCVSVYITALALLVVLGAFRPGAGGIRDFIAGFRLGLCVGIGAVALFHLARYAAALRDEAKLKKLYIEEHDERLRLIRSRAGGTGMVVAIAGLLLGGIVAGYFSPAVFFSLIGAAVFVAFVVVAMKAYYWRKFSE